ncbi:hypothetical protein PINS_up016735 [Pythium insidiosum]|nr:hypothetical protein PINS_up016735 [Pythium insidiosum]
MKPVDKIAGSDAMLVFHDQAVDGLALDESALVSFDVRSSPNCVVSVCGRLRKWYMGYGEQCWGLKIAPKSSDPAKNGLISGISAAYTALRPVAKKMYLKFDSVNYIDGSECNYEVTKGTKTITKDPTPNVEAQR